MGKNKKKEGKQKKRGDSDKLIERLLSENEELRERLENIAELAQDLPDAVRKGDSEEPQDDAPVAAEADGSSA